MLANGITLSFKEKGGSTFTKLTGLKEVPELGIDPEKVENTTLEDTVKQYEMGIGDAGDLNYTFKYENKSAASSYRILRDAQDGNDVLTFEHKLPDGTTIVFDGQVSVKLGGGGVNGVIDFTLAVALQSDMNFTDPV